MCRDTLDPNAPLLEERECHCGELIAPDAEQGEACESCPVSLSEPWQEPEDWLDEYTSLSPAERAELEARLERTSAWTPADFEAHAATAPVETEPRRPDDASDLPEEEEEDYGDRL